MSERAANAQTDEPKKGGTRPVRFDEPEDELLRDIKRTTGMAMAEIVKRAGRFALPKFASGEVNILTLEIAASPVPLVKRQHKNGKAVARA